MALGIVACTLGQFGGAGAREAEGKPGVCAGRERVLVQAKAHRMLLCSGGGVDGELAVALGRGGIDKRAEGDNRTPLGQYPLGAPRASKEFGTFIPVGYPTAAQRAAGYSGGAVGIHGPKRGWRWLGGAARWLDWTRGCIALPHDEEVERVVAWLRRHPTAMVEITAE